MEFQSVKPWTNPQLTVFKSAEAKFAKKLSFEMLLAASYHL